MWPNPQFPTDLVTFIEEILNGKLHFCVMRFSEIILVKELKWESYSYLWNLNHGNCNLQSWTKIWRQIAEIKQNRFFHGMFHSWFFAIFYQKVSKFGFWLDGWVVAIRSERFRDFLEISQFPRILSLKSFGNSWANSCTYFLVIII